MSKHSSTSNAVTMMTRHVHDGNSRGAQNRLDSSTCNAHSTMASSRNKGGTGAIVADTMRLRAHPRTHHHTCSKATAIRK